MKKLSNNTLLNFYIEKYELNNILNKEIINYIDLFSFINGEFICSKDNNLNYMFFLVDGKVKTYTLHDNGKSLLLRFSKPFSIFGDVELLTNYNVSCNVESLGESKLLGIKMSILQKYACNDTRFLKFIIKNLSNKLYSTSNSVSINLLYPLESRLASYLLSIAYNKENIKDNIEINIHKSTEIAPLLGTSYRHLNRIIAKLVSNEIIYKNKESIIIKDIEKLKELSQGNIYESEY